MNYFVYILKCADGSFYTGIAKDLKKRIKQHNGLLKGGAIYTQNKNPVELKYFEEHKTRSLALKREYEIKQMTRENKQKLFLKD